MLNHKHSILNLNQKKTYSSVIVNASDVLVADFYYLLCVEIIFYVISLACRQQIHDGESESQTLICGINK